jgi:hypothetical protein
LPLTRKTGFRLAGWLAFAVRVSNPLDHYEGFQIEWSFPLPVLLTLQSHSRCSLRVPATIGFVLLTGVRRGPAGDERLRERQSLGRQMAD